MALQVWLPLNGNLVNQGLANVTVTNNGVTINDSGKIGKCIKTSQSWLDLQYNGNQINTGSISFGGWFKFNKTEISNSLNGVTFTSTAHTATGNLIGNGSYGGVGLIWITNNIYSSGSFSNISVMSYIRTSNNGQRNTSSFLLSFDTWTHIFLTYDRTNAILSLYINGELKYTVGQTAFTDAPSRNICLNYSGVYGGKGPGRYIPYYVNDVRIYDHCLNAQEVKEISKGLVLHYKLDDKNLISRTNLITNLSNGGQCTISNNAVNVSGNNSDTYFYIKTSRALTLNKLYRISCIGNFGNGVVYNFPIGAQSNTSQGLLKVQNGYCSLIFIANQTIVNAGTSIILDDSGRTPGVGTISSFVLEELNNIYDCSGYQNNGTLIGNLSINNDTPRYNNCTKNLSEYLLNSVFDFPESKGITFACWMNLTAWGSQISGIWATSTNSTTTPSDYSTTTCNHRDSGFDMRGTNGTTYRLTCGNADIPLNTWKHIAVTHDGTNAKLYINGSLVRTLSVPTSLVGFKSLFLGWSNAGGVNRRCQGSWSDFRIYATALSESDIKELYNTSGYITSNGAVCGYELEENYSNMLSVENYGIETKLWLNGLSSYTQSKCLCTLTDNGYRIYREPNLVYSSAGSVMWGGFVLRNTDNRYGFTKGQTYILQFEVKGLSSNNAKDVYWTNQVGWGGGGLEPQPSNVTIVNPVTLNFNSSEWKTFIYKWTINDEVYKTCTSSYSGFTSGTVYVSYRDFKFGFDYRDTGSLGTDLYIRNIRMYNITDNKNISIFKSGVIESGSVVERWDSSTKFLTGNVISTDNLIEI